MKQVLYAFLLDRKALYDLASLGGDLDAPAEMGRAHSKACFHQHHISALCSSRAALVRITHHRRKMSRLWMPPPGSDLGSRRVASGASSRSAAPCGESPHAPG